MRIEEEQKIEEYSNMERPPNYVIKRHFAKSLLKKMGQDNVIKF